MPQADTSACRLYGLFRLSFRRLRLACRNCRIPTMSSPDAPVLSFNCLVSIMSASLCGCSVAHFLGRVRGSFTHCEQVIEEIECIFQAVQLAIFFAAMQIQNASEDCLFRLFDTIRQLR